MLCLKLTHQIERKGELWGNGKQFILLLVAAMLIGTASAALVSETAPIVSPWAREEVEKAQELGFVPAEGLPRDYRSPITRQDFRQVAMQFAAMQERYDAASWNGMVSLYLAKNDADGRRLNPFKDGSEADALAYYLGLVQGDGDGSSRPEGQITREEAAVLLTRAYAVYGGTLPEEKIKIDFSDSEEIADWAKESAAALAFWEVVVGMENGSFAPKGNYTVEQCIIAFLRLYENTPVSRKQGNVKPLFAQEQGLDYLLSGTFISEDFRLEGPEATFIRTSITGVMQKTSLLHLVHRGGGVQRLKIGVGDAPNRITPALELQNVQFSEDGKTLGFALTLGKDVIFDGTMFHKRGTYQVTVDVDTAVSRLFWEA